MLRKRIPITVIIIVVMQLSVISVESRRVKSKYVGNNACKKCHASSAIGDQFKIWASSPHSRAYQTLLTEKASKIGGKFGIKHPSKNLKCLNTMIRNAQWKARLNAQRSFSSPYTSFLPSTRSAFVFLNNERKNNTSRAILPITPNVELGLSNLFCLIQS